MKQGEHHAQNQNHPRNRRPQGRVAKRMDRRPQETSGEGKEVLEKIQSARRIGCVITTNTKARQKTYALDRPADIGGSTAIRPSLDLKSPEPDDKSKSLDVLNS